MLLVIFVIHVLLVSGTMMHVYLMVVAIVNVIKWVLFHSNVIKPRVYAIVNQASMATNVMCVLQDIGISPKMAAKNVTVLLVFLVMLPLVNVSVRKELLVIDVINVKILDQFQLNKMVTLLAKSAINASIGSLDLRK